MVTLYQPLSVGWRGLETVVQRRIDRNNESSLDVLFGPFRNDISVIQSDLVNSVLETRVLISPGG